MPTSTSWISPGRIRPTNTSGAGSVYRVRYLTLRGARYQASVLRGRGAVVDILRSLPVQWPEVTP